MSCSAQQYVSLEQASTKLEWLLEVWPRTTEAISHSVSHLQAIAESRYLNITFVVFSFMLMGVGSGHVLVDSL